ncbi:MAG: hypothetical protein L0I76_37780 [Pseudonocardia sp.]|nr:hypothetical protein [Pseudonocardia sp.]
MITCPRRMETPAPWADEQDADDYLPDHGLGTQGLGCSYCGSLPPDEFMEATRSGVLIEPTDKDYKAYVGARGEAKFYFQHLDDAQRREFVELLNGGRITVGYPGRFYVLPFFVRREAQS